MTEEKNERLLEIIRHGPTTWTNSNDLSFKHYNGKKWIMCHSWRDKISHFSADAAQHHQHQQQTTWFFCDSSSSVKNSFTSPFSVIISLLLYQLLYSIIGVGYSELRGNIVWSTRDTFSLSLKCKCSPCSVHLVMYFWHCFLIRQSCLVGLFFCDVMMRKRRSGWEIFIFLGGDFSFWRFYFFRQFSLNYGERWLLGNILQNWSHKGQLINRLTGNLAR